MNISESTGMIILAAIGVALTTAIATMWFLFVKELATCKEDRAKLTDDVENLNTTIQEISKQLGRMEGHIEHIDQRYEKAFKGGGSEQIRTKT